MGKASVNSKGLAIVLLPLLLGACATGGGLSMSSIDEQKNSQPPLANAERSDRVRLAGYGEVAVSATYIAASGRECRKLETVDGRALQQRSCKDDKGGWYITRSISGPEPLSSSIQPVQTGHVVVESVNMSLNEGDSFD